MNQHNMRKPNKRWLDTGYLLPLPQPRSQTRHVRPTPTDLYHLPEPDNEIIDEGAFGVGIFAITITIVICIVLIAAALNAFLPI